ncbi:hypothetical protein [Reinekea sp.]|jgi:hypothetical protein|uniref:hypothetical protein n=1 Tax=Reinekea sp. TaxID=1970455 RepID=UPI002A7F95E2|nr:hypothetical protein [Reinekea sp.]
MRLTSISLALFGLLFGTAQATTVLYQNLNQLVDTSQHVLTGLITQMDAEQAADGDIYTTLVLQNAARITAAGATPIAKAVTLRFKGGSVAQLDKKQRQVGEQTLLTHGAPEFSLGDSLVVFVSHNGVADMPFVGFSQGVFKVNARQEVLTAQQEPIVGFQGADLISETAQGLMARGQFLAARTTAEQQSAEGVQLLSSDGGLDRLVQRSVATNRAALMQRQRSYAPVDVRNFVSMIQERKAQQLQTHGASIAAQPSLNDLLSLPALSALVATERDAQLTGPRALSGQTLADPQAQPILPVAEPEADQLTDSE